MIFYDFPIIEAYKIDTHYGRLFPISKAPLGYDRVLNYYLGKNGVG